MLGYVRVYKPELKMRDYETYRAVYCSLCRQLGKSFGPVARMCLNYDFTFLAMLGLALESKCPGVKKSWCAFNPLVRCNYLSGGDSINYAADVSIILTYYKLRDNLADRGFKDKVLSAVAIPFFALAKKRAATRRPDIEMAAREYISKQSKLESELCGNVDMAAEPTAAMLEFIFSQMGTDQADKSILGRLGYCIGKWIYLLDAADDVAKDVKRGNYNVLAHGLKKDDKSQVELAKQAITPTLNVCRTEAMAQLQLLDVKRYGPILENVILLGLEDAQKGIVSLQPMQS